MKKFLKSLAGFKAKKTENKEIIVVSGLPRSGTSMMMKMIEAGGVPVMIDNIRVADSDNPKGYYELERVKQLDKGGDKEWLGDAQGKVIKVIAALLGHMSPNYRYRVLFMNRRIEEVLKSQHKMLENRSEDTNIDQETIKGLLQKHAAGVKSWVSKQPNFEMLEVDYNALVQAPLDHIPAINSFLGGALDEQAMGTIVDPTLYRNR